MDITLRRVYFIVIIILFLIIAPLLLLFTVGWRFSFDPLSFYRVGALHVDTEPKAATVKLNNSAILETTPLSLKNIIPGNYNMLISKQGYYDYQKPITISSAKISSFNNILLLRKQSYLSPLINISFDELYLASNGVHAIGVAGTMVLLFDTAENKIDTAIALDTQIKNVRWSQDSSRAALFSDDGSIIILSTSHPYNHTKLSAIYNQTFDDAQWSIDENDILYGYSDAVMYRLNIFQKTHSEISNHPKPTNFIGSNFYISTEPTSLSVYDYAGQVINSYDIKANHSLHYYPYLIDDCLVMHDTANKNLLLYFYKENKFKSLPYSVFHFTANQEDSLLVCNNTHEIVIWDPIHDTAELFTRLSDTITDALLIADSSYILYTTDENKITISEYTKQNRNTYYLSVPNLRDIIPLNDSYSSLVYSDEGIFIFRF